MRVDFLKPNNVPYVWYVVCVVCISYINHIHFLYTFSSFSVHTMSETHEKSVTNALVNSLKLFGDKTDELHF